MAQYQPALLNLDDAAAAEGGNTPLAAARAALAELRLAQEELGAHDRPTAERLAVVRQAVELLQEEVSDRPDESRYRATIVELCRIGAADADLRGLLRHVAELAAEGLPHVAAASVVIGDPARPGVMASSSALAQSADGLQHRAGEGPVFDAFARGETTGTAALFTDARWPHLARISHLDRCTQAVLALPVRHDRRTTGVVVLYSGPDSSFTADLLVQAGPYRAAVQSLVRDCHVLEQMALVRDQLSEALTSRAVIDQAKGMIMMSRGCTADEAFALLCRMSGAANRKVRDVARDFVAEHTRGGHQPH